jgi:E3 ubiquitin-protein ligase BRE1
MQEYSRKAATAEARLEELHKRSVHHDDHIRIVDAWWRQVCTFATMLFAASICSRHVKHAASNQFAIADVRRTRITSGISSIYNRVTR